MQISTVIDKQSVGVHELRRNLTKLLNSLKKNQKPVVVTHQGKTAVVLTSVANYTQMLEMIDELQLALKELADKNYIRELIKEEAKVKTGGGVPADKLYDEVGV